MLSVRRALAFHPLSRGAGAPSQAVLDFASQTKQDLIVLGLDNHRSLYEGPSLSHAYEIVPQARCPVSVRSGPRIELQY